MKQSEQESGLPSGLAQPAQRALGGAGIHTLEQLARFGEEEVRQWHGIGPNALAIFRRALSARGLSFAEGKKDN